MNLMTMRSMLCSHPLMLTSYRQEILIQKKWHLEIYFKNICQMKIYINYIDINIIYNLQIINSETNKINY